MTINLLFIYSIPDVFGLKCYFGLGNTSEKDKQKTMECPEKIMEKMMICRKMFGGGMGDQIKRYCDYVEPEVIYFKLNLHFVKFTL